MSGITKKNIDQSLKFVYSDNNSLSVIFHDNNLLMGVVGEFNKNLQELEVGALLFIPDELFKMVEGNAFHRSQFINRMWYFDFSRISHSVSVKMKNVNINSTFIMPVKYMYNPTKTIKTNTMGTLNMLGTTLISSYMYI